MDGDGIYPIVQLTVKPLCYEHGLCQSHREQGLVCDSSVAVRHLQAGTALLCLQFRWPLQNLPCFTLLGAGSGLVCVTYSPLLDLESMYNLAVPHPNYPTDPFTVQTETCLLHLSTQAMSTLVHVPETSPIQKPGYINKDFLVSTACLVLGLSAEELVMWVV